MAKSVRVVEKIHRIPQGQTDEPEEHRGRPTTSHTEENCGIVEIHGNPRVKVREIAEMTGISKSIVHEIIANLNFRKVSFHWVPKTLTEEHINRRMAASIDNVYRYHEEAEDFVQSIVMESAAFTENKNFDGKHLDRDTTRKARINWRSVGISA